MGSELLHFIEKGSGPPLLLVHGLMITGEMFKPVIERLSANHRVIVPDLRGHGRSRRLSAPYTTERLATDLSELLKHLGIDSTAVLGYSQGGAIAQQLVLSHPDQCNRLVLACTYAFNMATLRERLEGYTVPFLINILGMKLFSKLIISMGLKQVNKERAEWVVGLISNQDSRLMNLAWKAAMTFDSRDLLNKIECPTLIIAAANDTAVPLHHAETLHKGIPCSKLVIIDGANHALIWQRSEEFLKVAEEFLSVGSASMPRPISDKAGVTSAN